MQNMLINTSLSQTLRLSHLAILVKGAQVGSIKSDKKSQFGSSFRSTKLAGP